MLWPITVPSRTLSAANSVVVPCRKLSWVIDEKSQIQALDRTQPGPADEEEPGRDGPTVRGYEPAGRDTAHFAQLGGKGRILGQLEASRGAAASGTPPRSAAPSAATHQWSWAIAWPVQWVALPGGSVSVTATTRSTSARGNRARPGFLLFSRSRTATPWCKNRSCQR
jgi:hypothetical protein